MDTLLAQLSGSVSQAHSLEALARPLLALLEAVTGLESTFLTTVDLAGGLQHVVYAHNTRDLRIREGQTLPWGDTPGKRTLAEGRLHADDAGKLWGDCGAARELGLQTCVSAPVRGDDGTLYGMLCAASSQRSTLSETAQHALRLFARLIEQHVERESLAEKLRCADVELKTQALTDALTGLPNRRALMQELVRLTSLAQRNASWMLAGAIDLDGFKQINEAHGHDAGDEFLSGVAVRLSAALRGGDVIARMGSDEFVVIGLGPKFDADGDEAARLLQQRLAAATAGVYAAGAASIDYAGASVGVVCLDPLQVSAEQVLRESDAAMYRVKLMRRQQGLAPPARRRNPAGPEPA